MDTLRSAPAQAPSLIPILIPDGPANRGGNAPLSQVRRPEDLPNHLFVGEIEPGRFALTNSGWEAFYFGLPEDTALKITYRSATASLSALTTFEMYYRGVRGALATYNGDDMHRLVQFAFPKGMPAEWHQPLRDALTSRYNLCVISQADSDKFVAYSPSGILFDLLVPVPIARLCDCVEVLRRLQADGLRVAPVHAALRHVTSTVRHRGGAGRWLGSPESQLLRAWHATGLRPPRMPEWQTEGNGSRGLYIAREHYVIEVHCYLVDLEHIVRCFAESGLVGLRAESRGLAMADSPDYPAVARLFRPDLSGHKSTVVDDNAGRRVDYSAPLLVDSWALGEIGEEEIEAALGDLAEYVRTCEDFERVGCTLGRASEAEGGAASKGHGERQHAEVELDEDSQPLGDAIIEALGDEPFLVADPAIAAFQEWCDYAGFFEGVNEVVCCGEYSIRAPEPGEIIYRALESFTGKPTVPRILGHLRETWESLSVDYEEWGLERPYRIAAPLRHSDGTLRTLGFVFSNFYSPIECDGIFADREAYESWLASQGLVAREQDLDRIALRDVLGRWARR